MRFRLQSGAVMVELLIAMAVTSLVLLGLSSVVFVGSNAYQAWAAPIQYAQTGPPLGVLAAALQGDVHRLVPCQPSGNPSSTLDLCFPNLQSSPCPLVRYSSSAGGSGFELLRSTWSPAVCVPTSQQTMLRNLSASPTFTLHSCSSGATSAAVIAVTGIQYPTTPTGRQLNVYVVAPVTSKWDC